MELLGHPVTDAELRDMTVNGNHGFNGTVSQRFESNQWHGFEAGDKDSTTEPGI